MNRVVYTLILGFLILSACTRQSTIETEMPQTFSVVAANPVAPLQAEIVWQKAKGAVSYKISYGTSSGVYTNTISVDGEQSSSIVKGLEDGVTYFFKVTASNVAGAQTSQNEISITSYGSLALSSVSPSHGFFAGGQTITLTGVGFKPGSNVLIGGSHCTSVNIASTSSITCKTPRRISSGVVNVTVNNSDGKVVTLMNSYSYKSDSFQFLEFYSGSKARMGHKNSIGTGAKFFRPTKPIIYNGYVYVSDTGNHIIRRMNLTTKQVEDVAGEVYKSGLTDGVGNAARFKYPMGMVRVGSDIYIADSGNCSIRKLDTLTNIVTSMAGHGVNNCLPSEDPVGAFAGFGIVNSVASDGNFLFVGDDSGAISKVSLTSPYATTWLQGSTSFVIDLVYLNNALYYAENDASIYAVVKMDLSVSPETVSLVAGGSGTTDLDGIGAGASFSTMGGIETDGTDLYVTCTKANKIKKVTIATQAVTTLVGNGTTGILDGIGTAATLSQPAGLFYYTGDLYFVSVGSSDLRKSNLSTNLVTTIAGGGQ